MPIYTPESLHYPVLISCLPRYTHTFHHHYIHPATHKRKHLQKSLTAHPHISCIEIATLPPTTPMPNTSRNKSFSIASLATTFILLLSFLYALLVAFRTLSYFILFFQRDFPNTTQKQTFFRKIQVTLLFFSLLLFPFINIFNYKFPIYGK